MGKEGTAWLANLWQEVPALRADELTELGKAIETAQYEIGRLERQFTRFSSVQAHESSTRILDRKREELARLSRRRARLKELVSR